MNQVQDMTTVDDLENLQREGDIQMKYTALPAATERNNILQFDVTFKVPNKKGTKAIVSHASDLVSSGQTLAIMGPSGAGKTTLLKVLTMEAYGGDSIGSLTLNGTPLTADRFSSRCALVAQADYHWAFLTCRETIAYAADLFMNASRDEKTHAVNSMLKKTGLESCADTIVGSSFMKGLSGGQMRRLSLAVILMKKLDVIILDEPTSGLDAASATGIMSFLGELTKSEGLITIYTIHQPSTQIYNTFDRIMLLTDGRIAYCGTRENVIPYFEKIQMPVPPQTNPAEFMLDIVNKDFSDAAHVNSVIDAWTQHGEPENQLRIKNILETFDVEKTTKEHSYNAGLFSQVITMFKRHGKLAIRDPTLYSGRALVFLIAAIFFGIIYVESRDRVQEQALSRIWFVMWIIAVPSNMGVVAVYAYNIEYNAIRREVKNGMISALPYLFANTILLVPVMFLFAVATLSVGAYGIMDFNGERYGDIILIYACMLFSFESIAQMLSVAFDNPLMGMLNFMQVWFAAFLFSGFFITIDDIVWPFRILSYILPLRYTAEAVVYQEYIAMPFKGASLCDPGTANCLSFPDEQGPNEGWTCGANSAEMQCYGHEGWQVLRSLGSSVDLVKDDTNTGINIAILIAIAVGARLIYMVQMTLKSNRATMIHPPKA